MESSEIEVMLFRNRVRDFFASDRCYDPVRGTGCTGLRVRHPSPLPEGRVMIPLAMVRDPDYSFTLPVDRWKALRCRHDFEYWAATCVRIKDKTSGADIPFRLNRPQRHMLGVLETERLARRPIRVILLKARQWGGSTLVQMYMAWIQTVLCRNWHSVICAHQRDASANILGMYSKLLAHYPPELWQGDVPPGLKPFERCANIRTVAGRDCRIAVATSEKPDGVRGGDYAMAHLSETAYWRETPQRSPRAVMQSICGSVALLPDTLVVIESTANGVGDYFHSEWLRGKAGASDKIAVFVPWFEIPYYRLATDDPEALALSLSDYERGLWTHGATLEHICWYRRKSLEFDRREQLCAEFPSDDMEAFCDTAESVFPRRQVEELRNGCSVEPVAGDVDMAGTRFTPCDTGMLKVWEMPCDGQSYVVAVDVGGRSAKADWSVIAVLVADGERPRVAAQWRGHIDHDLLARKSAAIGRFYGDALLVIESNTFETEAYGGAADSNLFILSRIAEDYPNMYRRRSFDTVSGQQGMRIGFHTNRATKSVLIDGLVEMVRDTGYVERDHEACNELLTYRQLPNGSYAAKDGCHDDILMTRAIALHVIRTEQPVPLPRKFTQHYGFF